MPNEWLCMDCDVTKHQSLALHNRESCVNGVFKPIEPRVCFVHKDGEYELVSQGSIFVIYLKVDTFCFLFCVIFIPLITTLIGPFSAISLIYVYIIIIISEMIIFFIFFQYVYSLQSDLSCALVNQQTP